MTVTVSGCNVFVKLKANDSTHIVLPDGYSYNRLFISTVTNNIWGINNALIAKGYRIEYPVVNSKSPNYIDLSLTNTSEAEIRFTIEKFGQIPDSHYFDKAFDPILVTDEDGKEYNVIPSDQFK